MIFMGSGDIFFYLMTLIDAVPEVTCTNTVTKDAAVTARNETMAYLTGTCLWRDRVR